jgi:hypothetical protein
MRCCRAAAVSSWSPPLPERIDPILWQQLQQLYAADPQLAATFAGINNQSH